MVDSRIRWRCRRGIRELDIALQNFLESEYDRLTPDEKGKFQELLEIPDPLLMDWLYGRESPLDKELVSLVERIRNAAACPAKIR
jgi:antitoxin CptB